MTIIGKRISAKAGGGSTLPPITGVVEGFGSGTGERPSLVLLVKTDVGHLVSICTGITTVTVVKDSPGPMGGGVSNADLLELFAAMEGNTPGSVRLSFADSSYTPRIPNSLDDALTKGRDRSTRLRLKWLRLGEAAGLVDEDGVIDLDAINNLVVEP